MSFSTSGLNDALAGIIAVGIALSVHTADPGTTGASEDTAVVRVAANWGTPAAASVDSAQVAFAIPTDAASRTYTHFGVWDSTTVAGSAFKTGGPLDQSEIFSPNGGTLNFTGTLTAADATV